MKYHEMRVRIPNDVYKNYKLICVELDLSIPKQLTALISEFVMVQLENKQRSLK